MSHEEFEERARRAGARAVEAIALMAHNMEESQWQQLWSDLADDGEEAVMEFLWTLTGIAGGLVEMLAEACEATPSEILSDIALTYAEV